VTIRYLTGQPGTILYGGEEYDFPGGKQSEEALNERWGRKLAAKGITASHVMEHANTYVVAGPSGPTKRYDRTWE
jgi:hypothetical protein